MTRNPELIEALITDYRTAQIKPRQRVMLDYADKLTRTPWDISETDLLPLREAGWNDRAILDINQTVSYYAYVNRVADGLGVVLDDYARNDPA